jgi:hypothetical protein
MEIEGGWVPDQKDIVKEIHRTDAQVDVATAIQWGVVLAVVVGVAAGALDTLKKNRVRGLALSGVVFASGVVANKTLGGFIDRCANKKTRLNSLQK